MTPEETVDRLMSDYLRSGWMRHLPRNAFTTYEAVLWLHVEDIAGEIEEQPLGSWVSEHLAQIGGLRAGVWDEHEAELLRNPGLMKRLLSTMRGPDSHGSKQRSN